MDRTLELELTAQALTFVDNRLGDYAEQTYEVPVEVYTSLARYEAEMATIFHGSPIIAGLSCEVAEPGSFKTLDMAGMPVLVQRDGDGTVQAFLNVCRHRGATLVEERSGSARRLVCPYHGWSYDSSGALVGVAGANVAFDDMCRENRSLTPMPTAERHGVIWVTPSTDAGPIDLDAHLGPLDAELPRWSLGECAVVDTRIHEVDANWKLVVETFLENYHLKSLHKNTLAPIMTSYGTCHLPLGDSQRMVYPGTAIEGYKDRDPDTWQGFAEWAISVVYNMYPNTVLVLLGEHYQLFQVFPGRTPGTCSMIQTVVAPSAEQAESNGEALMAQADLLSHVLTTEDLHVARQIEASLRSGANPSLVFGKNEIPAHHFHDRLLDRLAAAGTQP